MRMSSDSHSYNISFDELEGVISLVQNVYEFNFDGYSRASLKRRVSRIMQLKKINVYDLRSLLVNDSSFFDEFLLEITVNVTEMFRDPGFYRALREKVFPYLSSYPQIKTWNAGCSTGEELYSFAILLAEEKLYDRSFLYGTDINSKVVEFAKRGVYSLKNMKQYSENYIASGALRTLANYYVARYDAASIQNQLKKNILFSVHNLVSDGVFNEFQIVSCRNVLIYFNTELQDRVIQLFYDSLCPLGFLCLGSKETIRNEKVANKFKVIDKVENIYQKIA